MARRSSARTTEDLWQALREKYGSLSDAQKRLADYMLSSNLYDLCFLSSDAFGKRAGVSSATVVRFSVELGFSGYADLQDLIRDAVRRQLFALPDIGGHSAEADLPNGFGEEDDFVSEFMKNDAANLIEASRHVSREQFAGAANALAAANKVYILGCRSSAGVALLMSSLLNSFHGNTFPLTVGIGDLVDRICTMDESDVLVAISWAVYTRHTLEGVEIAKSRNVHTIGITDRDFSPIALACDTVLSVSSPGKASPTTALVSVATALVSSVAKRLASTRRTRIKEIEAALTESKLFLLGPIRNVYDQRDGEA